MGEKTEFQPGDDVEIVICAKVTEITRRKPYDATLRFRYTTFEYGTQEGEVIIGRDAHVRQAFPAEGPVRPNDLWRDCHGGLWFGVRYWPNRDDEQDRAGINHKGWRPALVPADAGVRGKPLRPEEVCGLWGPIRLVHREPDGDSEGGDG